MFCARAWGICYLSQSCHVQRWDSLCRLDRGSVVLIARSSTITSSVNARAVAEFLTLNSFGILSNGTKVVPRITRNAFGPWQILRSGSDSSWMERLLLILDLK